MWNVQTFWQAKLFRGACFAWCQVRSWRWAHFCQLWDANTGSRVKVCLAWCQVRSWRWAHVCQLWDANTGSRVKVTVSIHHLIRRQVHIWHYLVRLVRLSETRFHQMVFANSMHARCTNTTVSWPSFSKKYGLASWFYIAIHQVSLLSTPLPRWAKASYSYTSGGVRQ